MKHAIFFSFLLVVGLISAGCGEAGQPIVESADPSVATNDVQPPTDTVDEPSTNDAAQSSEADLVAKPHAAVTETLVDEQGAVSVAVRPLNVERGEPTLDFEVALNTHSVDLSMDLARLAWLTIDTGLEVSPVAWEAPRGGHHVTGVLSFPAEQDGSRLLEQASVIQLTLKNLDAPTRTFTWSLQ